MLEILVGLIGLVVVPWISSKNARIEQIAHIALTVAFLAEIPSGATLTLVFLALNSACYLGAEKSTWRTRFAAAVFLALYARGKWVLAGISVLYAVTVFVVTVLENRKEFSGIFTKGGKK